MNRLACTLNRSLHVLTRVTRRSGAGVIAPLVWMTLVGSAIGSASSSQSNAPEGIRVPNPSFEAVAPGGLAAGWTVGIGGGASARVELDEAHSHSGKRSVHLSNASARKAFVYASFCSDPIPIAPATTYHVRFYARGIRASGCYVGISFVGNGDRRLYMPSGDFGWQSFTCSFTTPERGTSIRIQFCSDDVTESLWIDDVSLERTDRQWANLTERTCPRPFAGAFPRSKGPIAGSLVVYDCTRDPFDVRLAVTALQGLVNRTEPRIYLINPTNPAVSDALWLSYLHEKGYTGPEQRVTGAAELIARFRDGIDGAVAYDPELPGSVNAACMLAGIMNALPLSPKLSKDLGLPVLMDLRGRWTRNVDASRFVYDHYWDRMSHHVLAWIHPLSDHTSPRDYMVQHNVFCFWLSGYADREKGADPPAEEAFIDELLASTPANIPVMGWPAYGDGKGVQEYTGVRWLSEYGKFVPGTEFCSNLSVHSAVRPEERLGRRRPSSQPLPVRLQPDKTYLSVNVLDSGDALWYWQAHQRKIWADPTRGTVPIGWGMNVTLVDTLPAVLEWYRENATPSDTFFAAISGLGYMNTGAWAARFCAADRERIWAEYVRLTDDYCRRLGLDGIALYNGSWGEPTPSDSRTFVRFVRGMSNLRYILADLGRHETIKPGNSNDLIDKTAVFHTLTRFQVWSASADVLKQDMNEANEWLLGEIRCNTPAERPGFMSVMAISWYYYPSWFVDLKRRLPANYVLVGPADLADVYRQARHK
jgi:hypothetical protein